VSDVCAQGQWRTQLFPSLPLIRGFVVRASTELSRGPQPNGNARRRSPMFLIGSPGREDGSLSQEAARAPQLFFRATPALPGTVYDHSPPSGNAV